MSGDKSKNLKLHLFNQNSGVTMNELNENFEVLDQREAVINLGLGVIPENFPKLPGEVGDEGFLQRAIDYAEANEQNVTLSPRKYILHDTLYYNWARINGNGATLSLTTADKPILMHRVLRDKTSGITARGLLENLIFEGNVENPNNHGLYCISYWSIYQNLEFINIGGRAIYMSHKHEDGTILATGTLIENKFLNIIVRSSGDTAIFLGEADNNKITDGVLNNIIVATDAWAAIDIGSAAGWHINGVHTYGIQTWSLNIENGFNTTIDNIYIEQFREVGINLGRLQRNVILSNVNIDGTYSNDGSSFIRIDKSSWVDVGDTSLSITNLNMFHEGQNKNAYAFGMINPVNISATNVQTSGLNKGNIILPELDDDNIQISSSFSMKGDLSEEGDLLLYNDRQLKICDYQNFGHQEKHSLTFKLPPTWDYGKIIARIVIDSSWYDNGYKVASWEGTVYISRKSARDTIAVYVRNIYAPEGFKVNPVVTVTKIDQSNATMNVAFTQRDKAGTGVVAVDYIVCKV
ncbi:hypothetical protein ACH0B5_07215 [Ureibacillus sp. 179-F W5.1 NHS]|uniref:Pectate lyase superfamily protein domain-containing protein n=1 Tax=Lysinibacillus halotolerans TaxID=1368476 RepID=A0A3M8H4I3_9BACI|nr:hypothetical protein [Lysinibacillus halotolerans]RNC97355.1 hypothetical protein EC501_15705 [Lysinibacillus halotolerans]